MIRPMPIHRATFTIRTTDHNQVVDITDRVQEAVRASGLDSAVCAVYTPHATAAIAVNENDDPNIGVDLMRALGKMVPEHDGWLHDRVDDNAAAHIKSAIVGPSESIPVEGGRLALGRWQNVFFCEFDGPRSERRITVTIVG
jgi:secondary thiamine-phosphate synthase enzyme